MISVNKVFW